MVSQSLRLARRVSRRAWRLRVPGAWRAWALPLLALSSWEALVRLGWLPAYQMPAPSGILLTLVELARGELWGHVGASLARVAAGFAIGSGLALAVGTWVGLSRRAEAYLEPSFQALRAIPSLAWVPLLLLWFGIDETPKIVLIALGAFFPVYLALVAGVRGSTASGWNWGGSTVCRASPWSAASSFRRRCRTCSPACAERSA